ncbi:CoA transferase [Diaphorobacter sp. HDW4A]|uniref:CaiB/BaiF CoA transferase family protein n=1 Tax=Diaphorobacter sp. HDW4A TaxID=2714924 RepID=UPI001409786A|nr:CaiB/BaiF CoA-transferase family protein [Diaphorobacter sp. HDW4A]QIL79287.1 CoA transferase [Diaphorobacter sp. HDW4A]
MNSPTNDKPLRGLRVLEVDALGPVPLACMMLADWGAEVVRVENPASRSAPDTYGSVLRGRVRVTLDLKNGQGQQEFMELAESADVLVEGMRPGVMERLGLGPEAVFEKNEHLVYARMTGWGQEGPLASEAGHDINYIALSGVLHAIGPESKPAIPLNLIGDFAGGSCFLLMGVLAALYRPRVERRRVVIDAAMVDGVSVLMSLMHSRQHMGQWQDQRASNPLDGALPWYDTYRTKDQQHIAVGALEPKFYAHLIDTLGLKDLPSRDDRGNLPTIRAAFERTFATRSRDEWAEIFKGKDACVTPVLNMADARTSPHLTSRSTFALLDGEPVPAPAPIFNNKRSPIAQQGQFAEAKDAIRRWRGV